MPPMLNPRLLYLGFLFAYLLGREDSKMTGEYGKCLTETIRCAVLLAKEDKRRLGSKAKTLCVVETYNPLSRKTDYYTCYNYQVDLYRRGCCGVVDGRCVYQQVKVVWTSK